MNCDIVDGEFMPPGVACVVSALDFRDLQVRCMHLLFSSILMVLLFRVTLYIL